MIDVAKSYGPSQNRVLKIVGTAALLFFISFAAVYGSLFNFFILFVIAPVLVPVVFLRPADVLFLTVLLSVISGGMIGGVVYALTGPSIIQYPLSMRVFYANHPNMTVTQNCTDIMSALDYVNGQPINLVNTTRCLLPASISKQSNPFACTIDNENISCIGGASPVITWQGTIVDVGKR